MPPSESSAASPPGSPSTLAPSSGKGGGYFGYIAHDGVHVGPETKARQMGRQTMVWERDPAQIGGRGSSKLDMCCKGIKSLATDLPKEGPNMLHSKLQTIYLRSNRIASLAPLSLPLHALHILDVCFNELAAPQLKHLASAPGLYQLYLSGNNLKTLDSLPCLNELEVLVASSCHLTSLHMPLLPKLLLFTASDNCLESFKGLPSLTSLQTLQMSGNVALEGRERLPTAAAMIIGKSLQKFSGQTDKAQLVTKKTFDDTNLFPAYVINFLQMGWVLPSDEELAAEGATIQSLANDFLGHKEARTALPPTWRVVKVGVDAGTCGVLCKATFDLEETDVDGADDDVTPPRNLSHLSHTLQWFRTQELSTGEWEPIADADAMTYIPEDHDVGYMLKVQLTVHEPGFGSLFALTEFVVLGTKEPKAHVTIQSGFPLEGETLEASTHVVWCTTKTGAGAWSWFRLKEGEPESSAERIDGAVSAKYTLMLDDVGHSVSAKYTPRSGEGITGVPGVERTPTVEAHSPVCRALAVDGACKGGYTLTATPTYFGGFQGACEFQWLRTAKDAPEGSELVAIEGATEATLDLAGRDVGCFVTVQYTPVNTDGERGPTVSEAAAARVEEGIPVVSELKIVGTFEEGQTVHVDAWYCGGQQGDSDITWLAVAEKEAEQQDVIELASSASRELKIPFVAIGRVLEVRYTPRRDNGETGRTRACRRAEVVVQTHPVLTSVVVRGEAVEGSRLTCEYDYMGGVEGETELQWLRVGAITEEIEDATSDLYKLRVEDVGCTVACRVTPARSDGVVGQPVVQPLPVGEGSTEAATVKYAVPAIKSLAIKGAPAQGETLVAAPVYSSGAEHSFRYQWCERKDGGELRPIADATAADYLLTKEHIGVVVAVKCTPVRQVDDESGETVVQETQTVTAALPLLSSVAIVGDLVEGQVLDLDGEYFGGEMGDMDVVWKRVTIDDESGEAVAVETLVTSATLTLGPADLSHFIEAAVVPIRDDGVRGKEVTVRSERRVKPCAPSGTLALPEQSADGMPIVPTCTYRGGKEGNSTFAWYNVPSLEAASAKSATELAEAYAELADTRQYVAHREHLQHDFLAVLWIPARADGEIGEAVVACTSLVLHAPAAKEVTLEVVQEDAEALLPVLKGRGRYAEGVEGQSTCAWWRVDEDGAKSLISEHAAEEGGNFYESTVEDYGYNLTFSFTPVRADGVKGQPVFAKETGVVFPPPPIVHEVVITGECMERGTLSVRARVGPTIDGLEGVKVKYVWKRHDETLGTRKTYAVHKLDLGVALSCTAVAVDTFGRSSDAATVHTQPVAPGAPMVEQVTVGWSPKSGGGSAAAPLHTCRYVAFGQYAGGVEGSSTVAWFRKPAIPGRTDVPKESMEAQADNSFHACVDDVGYVLVASYTPVRADGVAGEPVEAESQVVQADPAVETDVQSVCRAEGDALYEIETPNRKKPSDKPMRLMLHINKQRVKLVKPGGVFLSATLVKGQYKDKVAVQADRRDDRRLLLTLGGVNTLDVTLPTPRTRDTVVQTIRRLAHAAQQQQR